MRNTVCDPWKAKILVGSFPFLNFSWNFVVPFEPVYVKMWKYCVGLNLLFLLGFSDEDIDLNSLIKSWLRSQPEEYRYNLENWIGDYFEKALNWVVKQVGN